MRIGIANPAAEYCVAHGGTPEIVETPQGQMGICRFPDGSYCEEFAYASGECQPGGRGSSWWKYFAVGVSCGIVGIVIGRSM